MPDTPPDNNSSQRPPQKNGGGGPRKPEGQQQAPPPRLGRGMTGWLVIIALIAGVALLLQAAGPKADTLKWSEFEALYNEGSIEKVEMTGRSVLATRTDRSPDGEDGRVKVDFQPSAIETWTEKVDTLTEGNFSQTSGPGPLTLFLINTLPFMLLFILIIFLIVRAMRSASGGAGMLGSFGKSRHKVMMKDSTGITFKNVAGIEEAKEEVEEIAQFLRNPKKFMRLGGRIPRGVLLTGPPGCGKTLLAKAIAGEADVPFFSISGSDFVEMFVGVGASRVRDLFKQARENSPCIIFLDEIDAVGRRRGGGYSTGGHDEREQTLNAILVEMDGFDSSDQIIVIASTNRPDVLDPALTRPGRFDRQISVPLPDVKGRYEILQVHARKVKLAGDADLKMIARGTPMFSGAELEAIINEAAIIATLENKDCVEHNDLEEARDKVRFGRARKSRVREEEDNRLTAYHEAGHAVLQVLLDDADPLHKVTIIPRGASGGATYSLPERDRQTVSRKWVLATMRVLCGGRIAEEKALSDVSSGAEMDIRQLTAFAKAMVLEWGMSEKLGFIRYASDDRNEMFSDREYSEETAKIIDEEVRAIIEQAYTDATQMLEDRWDRVEALAEALLVYETLTAKEVERLMRGERLGKPTVSDLLAAEAEKVTGEPRGPRTQPAHNDSDDTEPGVGTLPNPA